ncbi:MAG: TetR/AcrR family transcriptional regulator [Dorea sp.]|nr:TetR/AcrR family transcriptional regulator [Dorea sp.]
MDLRVEKTEKGIKNAFIELRSRKPLEKITIKELCESAQINKSTFYSHYKDIYDLSDHLEEEVVASITNSVSHPEYIVGNLEEFSRELLMAYTSQTSLTNILFSGNQRNHFADRIEESIKKMFYEKYPEYEKDDIMNITLSFCIQGGYHAFQRNRNVDNETLVTAIGKMTALLNQSEGD